MLPAGTVTLVRESRSEVEVPPLPAHCEPSLAACWVAAGDTSSVLIMVVKSAESSRATVPSARSASTRNVYGVYSSRGPIGSDDAVPAVHGFAGLPSASWQKLGQRELVVQLAVEVGAVAGLGWRGRDAMLPWRHPAPGRGPVGVGIRWRRGGGRREGRRGAASRTVAGQVDGDHGDRVVGGRRQPGDGVRAGADGGPVRGSAVDGDLVPGKAVVVRGLAPGRLGRGRRDRADGQVRDGARREQVHHGDGPQDPGVASGFAFGAGAHLVLAQFGRAMTGGPGRRPVRTPAGGGPRVMSVVVSRPTETSTMVACLCRKPLTAIFPCSSTATSVPVVGPSSRMEAWLTSSGTDGSAHAGSCSAGVASAAGWLPGRRGG